MAQQVGIISLAAIGLAREACHLPLSADGTADVRVREMGSTYGSVSILAAWMMRRQRHHKRHSRTGVYLARAFPRLPTMNTANAAAITAAMMRNAMR